MNMPIITIIGLGYGNGHLIPDQARSLIEESSWIYTRACNHTLIRNISKAKEIIDFDELFRDPESLPKLSSQISEQIIKIAKRSKNVVYLTPGNPYLGDQISFEITKQARNSKIQVNYIILGDQPSAIFSELNQYPSSQLFIVDALELSDQHVPPFSPGSDVLISHINSQTLALQMKKVLLSVYPSDHPIQLLSYFSENDKKLISCRLSELGQNIFLNEYYLIYLSALDRGYSFEAFQEIIAHLRAPDGCPWDKEQTHLSLRSHLLEETYELLNAIDNLDKEAMQEEFGDLLLQIVLHAQIASESSEFNMNTIIQGVYSKIIRRHPHVFSDLHLVDTKGVLLNWERLKEKERQENDKGEASLLDGVALTLPGLLQADQYQRRAARVGFDWSDLNSVLDKLNEELLEVNSAHDDESRTDEIGDLLFAVVNLARWYKIDPENALRATNEKFRRRFSYIEKQARLAGRSVDELSLDEMENYWQEAKSENRISKD
jgi:tetrapyrrole methylase family protein / MazG family protein